MNTKEIVSSWKWRIVQAGFTQSSFCKTLNLSRAAMSNYLSGKTSPSLETFDTIEGFLKDKGV